MWVFFGRITRDLPRGRAQVGDRHLKFHEARDNLGGNIPPETDPVIAAQVTTAVNGKNTIAMIVKMHRLSRFICSAPLKMNCQECERGPM